MLFQITGQVVEEKSGQGLAGLIVKAYDKDLLYDDLLGYVETDQSGNFKITYEGRDFQELFDRKPDIYLKIKSKDGQDIYSTERNVRFEAGQVESFNVEIPEDALANLRSRELSLNLYESWVSARQNRPKELRTTDNLKELEEARKENLLMQLIQPRQQHLQQLKEVSDRISTADKVAILVALELPQLEISTLLNRLSRQLSANPNSTYFDQVNQADNCGCGCGCCCGVMLDFPYEERIRAHRETKPFSIDPFNEVGIPEQERDALLIRDFLRSYEALSTAVGERVQKPLYRVAHEV
jgi:hypothetical protein